MIVTVKFSNEMFRMWGDHIDKPFEEYLLATYEAEPFPYEWTEEDLYYQIRKLIQQYEEGNLDITVPSKEERLTIRYETLKDSYIKLLHENSKLQKVIEDAKNILNNADFNQPIF